MKTSPGSPGNVNTMSKNNSKKSNLPPEVDNPEVKTVNVDGQVWEKPEGLKEFSKFHDFDEHGKVFVGAFKGRKAYDGEKLNDIELDWDKSTAKKEPEWTCLQFEDNKGQLWNLPDHFQIRQVLAANPKSIVFRVEQLGKRKLEGGKRSVWDYSVLKKG